MSDKPNTQFVSLAGGLGNQLFQFALGLNLTPKNTLTLEWSLGKPRLAPDGNPEILQFTMPDQVFLNDRRRVSWLEQRLGNLLLRISSSINSGKISYLFWLCIEFIAKTMLAKLFWKSAKIYLPHGTGFDSNLTRRQENILAIGYFQSYKWFNSEETLRQLSNLKLKANPDWLTELRKDAKNELPIILHIRLGDYRTEKKFGIPTVKYYESATREIWEGGGHKKIWIFSDETEIAKSILPEWILDNARWIGNKESSSAQLIEAMRLGSGYVLSNSTFGWWGAYLTYNSNAKVICPYPWFKFGKEPMDIVPPRWIRKPSWE